jgi:hypothetical protein
MADATVSLDEVLEALDGPDEWGKWVDRETGRVIMFPSEVMSAVEEDQTARFGDWEEVDVEDAKAVFDHPDRYVALPDRFEINEWDIMRDFAESRENRPHRKELLDAIHGSGAFRFFKSTIKRFGIEKDWYRFRDETMLDIAKRWLEENGLRCKSGRQP